MLRERGDGQARSHRAVLEHDLQVDRQRDHRAAQADLLKQLPGDPEPEQLGLEQVRVQQRRLARTLAPHQPPRQEPERDHPSAEQATASPPSCHTRMPSTMPPMPSNGQDGTHTSTRRDPVYSTSWISRMPDSTTDDDDVLQQKRDAATTGRS
jgi:hypothetical protein